LGLSDDIRLLPSSEEDALQASLVQFGDPHVYDKRWREQRRAIKNQSIFAPDALTKSQPSRPQGDRSAPGEAARPIGNELSGGKTEERHGGGRPWKRARLDPIPEDASMLDGQTADGGRWQMDSDFEGWTGDSSGHDEPAGYGLRDAPNAWKRAQLTANSQRQARKNLGIPPVSGKSKKKSILDKAKDALRRR
jgi:hypothetical protein